MVVGGGVVVYRLCGFWLGGGGGFAFLGLSDTVGGVGSVVVVPFATLILATDQGTSEAVPVCQIFICLAVLGLNFILVTPDCPEVTP